MKYKLAKELKDSGFPQKGNGKNKAYSKGGVQIDWAIENGDFVVYFPTLSELIYACYKAEFKVMGDLRLIDLTGFWSVSIYDGGLGERIHADGETPEIAVANLWLKINRA